MNFQTAVDAMSSVVLDGWKTAGYNPQNLRWNDLPGTVPAGDVTWGRVTIRHATGNQATLANHEGVRRYRRTGTVFVQIFAPVGDGYSSAYDYASTVVDSFQNAGGDPWYRNVRISEGGTSGAFEMITVLVDFTYDAETTPVYWYPGLDIIDQIINVEFPAYMQFDGS